MAPSKLLLSLLLCSTSVFAVDFFYPNHLNQTVLYTLPGRHFSGPNGEGIWESFRSKSDPTREIFNSSREIFPDAEATYNIDCSRNPTICLSEYIWKFRCLQLTQNLSRKVVEPQKLATDDCRH